MDKVKLSDLWIEDIYKILSDAGTAVDEKYGKDSEFSKILNDDANEIAFTPNSEKYVNIQKFPEELKSFFEHSKHEAEKRLGVEIEWD